MHIDINRILVITIIAVIVALVIVLAAEMRSRIDQLEQREPVVNVFIDGEHVVTPTLPPLRA